MKLIPWFSTAALLTPKALALIGYGIQMYHPYCAFGCGDSLQPAPLSCSVEGHAEGHHGHGGALITTPECRGNDSSWLATLAWCVRERCAEFEEPAWKLEQYWSREATLDTKVVPKWTYAQALREAQPPTAEFNAELNINGTMRVPYDLWNSQRRTLEEFERQETLHSRLGLVLLIIGFTLPIAATMLGYLPFMSDTIDKLKPYLVWPSTVGKYHVQPLPYLLGNVPTVGHSIYIGMFLILNILVAAIGYRSIPGNTWFASSHQEILAYTSARTGVLAFALAPLVVLFSGRNNFLLWCTNWSHSTYMLLHRWVARIFGLQVILHSLLELLLYQDMGSLAEEQVQTYWIWGIVATLAVCIMLAISTLMVRKQSYEIFLIIHIILAVFTIAGSWYHVEFLFERKWGYEFWLYAVCAVWFFDRLLRVLRITKVGIRRAKVTDIGTAFVRIDVEGVRWSAQPGYHAYAYFPTIKPLAPWENHPFSVVPTAILQSYKHSAEAVSDSNSGSGSDFERSGELERNRDLEKGSGIVSTTAYLRTKRPSTTSGISMYIRKSAGATGLLKQQDRLATLLDGPYTNNPTKDILRCDRLLLIAGGIGITGILPFANAHLNVRLCWSVKDYAECLVKDLETPLASLADKEIMVGQRFDLQQLISQEAEAAAEVPSTVKIGVVVCGPGSMCDDVRAIVSRAGRHSKSNVVFELEVDAFSW